MPPQDDLGSLERARERLYKADAPKTERSGIRPEEQSGVPHAWQERLLARIPHEERHVRVAGLFFIAAVLFFFFALIVAGYLFIFGGNAVSVDKVSIDVQGPTTISGGDTVPLSLIITNRNSATLQDATLEIDYPPGTRDASNLNQAEPNYTEKLGNIGSGASVTRTVKAVMFGNAGQSVSFPISLSYGVQGSNSTFVKKATYSLTISTTPLQVSVDTLSETVSGKPITFALTVRSNASVPLANVVLQGDFPFGFSVVSSSIPMTGSSFLLGTLSPGATKNITLVGMLSGQDREQRVFHFTVGTASGPTSSALAVNYMTQDATVAIAAPFIDTALSINGDTGTTSVIPAGAVQNVNVRYTNTLDTSVQNATVSISISGTAVDYNSIRTTSGFYRSSDHTVVFSQDTDPSLAELAPGASGVGAFSFATLPANPYGASPNVQFSVSVSGTRVGQANVPEQVAASMTRTVRVATVMSISGYATHTTGPFGNSGPVPPMADQATTYTVVLSAKDGGSPVAGGTITTTLPSYVTYMDKTSGTGTFTYNPASHLLTWNTGDLLQGGSAQGAFQVSLTPSTSQRGMAPQLTSALSFSGFDRYAGVPVKASAEAVTTETIRDPGYVPGSGQVQ
ncbi:MAG TPA: hypothetical protein VFP46_02415 [Candidatus Paceibacterota bacterium]|nr:hypothetical protein [Candidatus Paceibacterota bacterium]